MGKDDDPNRHKPSTEYSRQIGKIESRKLRAKQESIQTIWSGLAMFGLVGWSVAVPTLLGVAVGMWIDRHYPSDQSWTLILLVAGLCLGCMNAWHWVASEDKKIRKGQEKKDE